MFSCDNVVYYTVVLGNILSIVCPTTPCSSHSSVSVTACSECLAVAGMQSLLVIQPKMTAGWGNVEYEPIIANGP